MRLAEFETGSFVDSAGVTHVTDLASLIVRTSGGELEYSVFGDLFGNAFALSRPGSDSILTLSVGTVRNQRVGTADGQFLVGTTDNDTFSDGGFAVTMAGKPGNDVYLISDPEAGIIERAGQGTDTVKSSITHSLETFVENLHAQGTANIAGTGNTLANVLTGNLGNNVLNGGVGADRMAGSTGNDTYIVGQSPRSGDRGARGRYRSRQECSDLHTSQQR